MKDGYTLIEIMITLLLVGILATTSYPLFRTPILKAEQAIAKEALLETAMSLEEHHIEHQSYKTFTLSKSIENYRLTLKVSEEQFLLGAIRLKKDKHDGCGDFYIDEDGNKTVSGPNSSEICW